MAQNNNKLNLSLQACFELGKARGHIDFVITAKQIARAGTALPLPARNGVAIDHLVSHIERKLKTRAIGTVQRKLYAVGYQMTLKPQLIKLGFATLKDMMTMRDLAPARQEPAETSSPAYGALEPAMG